MKKLLTLVLLLITAGSLGFGYLKASETAHLSDQLEQAIHLAEDAHAEARRQEAIAHEQRAVAEKAAIEARMAQARAEQAVADCQKRRR